MPRVAAAKPAANAARLDATPTPLRSIASVAFASALFFGIATSAYAGPKDAEVKKLLAAAMDEDYLATEFDKAEKKLKDAVSKCGASGCSPDLLGKVYVALGTVHAKLPQALILPNTMIDVDHVVTEVEVAQIGDKA